MEKRVADIIVDTLLENNVDTCFTVVGGGAMHLNNAFEINKELDKTFCHHEQACAFAAEGYAKQCGKMAAVSVTSGPGAVNTLNGVYSAWVDSAPMIVIAGHPRYETTVEACGLDLRCRGVQEFDIIPAVQGMTKYAVMLKDANRVKYEVEKACHIAMEGRRGPVWISVPLDVQAKKVDVDKLERYQAEDESGGTSLKESIDEIITELRKAKRPCILTGSGLRTGAAMDQFYKMLEKVQIPVVGGALLSDILPEDYKYFYGLSGNIGPRAGNFILQNADYILVLANSMSNRQTGFNVEGFAPDAYITMVDASADEGKKPGLNISKQVTCDIKEFLSLFNNRIDSNITTSGEWISYCENAYSRLKNMDMPEIEQDGRVPAKYFWSVFRERIPKDAAVCLGNSNCVIGIFQLGVKSLDQRVITNYNAGSMGYDLPEAVGVAKASDNEVYCVTGDGSVMMNLQELETISYNKLPVKLVVFSNDGYGAIRQTCKNYFNGTYTGCDKNSGVDFPAFKDVANAFGFSYLHCKTVSEVAEKVDELVKAKGNVILEVDQKLDDPVLPKVMSKLKEDGTFETPTLLDMYPYLEETLVEELKMEDK